jgi:hypothetical protein
MAFQGRHGLAAIETISISLKTTLLIECSECLFRHDRSMGLGHNPVSSAPRLITTASTDASSYSTASSYIGETTTSPILIGAAVSGRKVIGPTMPGNSRPSCGTTGISICATCPTTPSHDQVKCRRPQDFPELDSLTIRALLPRVPFLPLVPGFCSTPFPEPSMCRRQRVQSRNRR